MRVNPHINTTFDFRSDTPPGKDPDALSPTLRKYHKLLWSKRLPGGAFFDLSDAKPDVYLYHRSEVGEFFLASDTVVPSFWREKRVAHIIDQMPTEEVESFNSLAYTIGGMMVFPGNRIDGRMTINGARGFHPRIKDRFDLTVECIRRHYLQIESPLGGPLRRYAKFFDLFESFRGYIEFFLLHDLVSEDFSAVKFLAPFNDFATSPVPLSQDAYTRYRQLAMEFIEARNSRISRS